MNDYMMMGSLYTYLMSCTDEQLQPQDKSLRTQLAATLNKYARNMEMALDISYEDSIERDIKMKKL